MSSLATAPGDPAPPVAARAANPPASRRRPSPRLLGLVLLGLLLSPGILAYPPAWHSALRAYFHWQAERHGYDLQIAAITGGPWNATTFHEIRARQHGNSTPAADAGTDLTIAQASMAPAWSWPWSSHPVVRVRSLELAGVAGQIDLADGRVPGRFLENVADRSESRLIPEAFRLQTEILRVRRGDFACVADALMLSASQNGPGEIRAHQVRANGPGFASVCHNLNGQTHWNGDRLTLNGLDLGNGLTLTSATFQGSHLGRRRLDWDGVLTALGGEIRAQGAVSFAHEHLAVEVAATLQRTRLAPLARLMSIPGGMDGLVEQASFTFRGDPEDSRQSQLWLAARATDFSWDNRKWESLDLQAVVVNRRVQLNRCELRQSANSLSLSGDCPLPPADFDALVWTGENSWWHAGGFNFNIDARLEDLRALAALGGPGMPTLAGRMSVIGQLSAAPARAEISGYLNVEGTRLEIRGAPLDYLRSTLVFRDGAVDVADVQATHGADYFTSRGTLALDHTHRSHAELNAEIADLGLYVSAFDGVPWLAEKAAGIKDVHTVLRSDDETLTIDQCNATRGDDRFQLTGQLSWTRTGHPQFDLHVTGHRPEGAREIPYVLELQQAGEAAPSVSGEITADCSIGALQWVPWPTEIPGGLLPLGEWFPPSCADWTLALHVAPATPQRFASGGEVQPDLEIVGTGANPRVRGRLEFSEVPTRLPGDTHATPISFVLYLGVTSATQCEAIVSRGQSIGAPFPTLAGPNSFAQLVPDESPALWASQADFSTTLVQSPPPEPATYHPQFAAPGRIVRSAIAITR